MDLLRRTGQTRWRLAIHATVTALALVATPTLVGIGLDTATAGAAAACTTTWKSPGSSGAFELAANWTNGAPAAAKRACIPAAATPYTVTETGASSAQRLEIGAGATFRLDATTGRTATLAIGDGGITNSGTVELASDPGHSATISATVGDIENDGTVTFVPSSGAATIDATLRNTSRGVLDAESSAFIARLVNGGFVSVADDARVDSFGLANYDGSTRTLSGGQYALAGLLEVAYLDVATLDAEVDITGSGALRDLTSGSNSLAHLSTINRDGSFSLDGGATLLTSMLTNNGRVLIGSGSALTTAGDYVEDGVYTALSAGSHLVPSDGTVVVSAGAIVGAGTILGPVANTGGTVYPAPQIEVTAGYTQQARGTLAVRLGASIGNGTLVVDGTATIAGTLSVSADSGLAPRLGTVSRVLQTNARLGSFDTVVTDALPAPFEFRAVDTGTDIVAAIVAAYDDDHPSVAYQGWSNTGVVGAIGGSVRSSCTAGDTAAFTFTGRSITWDTVRGPQMGRAQVLVDGVSKGVVDLYAADVVPFAKSFAGLGAGAHTITIRPTGAKNVASTNTCMVVDGFTAGTTFTDDPARSITWSAWKGVASGGGGYRSATLAGATVSFGMPTTKGFDWITRTGPDQGEAQIYVDGSPVKTVDLYRPTAHTGVRIAIAAPGARGVQVVVLGRKNSASTGTTVTFDGFVAR